MPGDADIGVLEIATVYRIIKAPDGWSSEDARAALRRAGDPALVRSAYGALADGRDGRTPPDARTEQVVRLDASHWTNVMDLYDAILPALGAPDWP